MISGDTCPLGTSNARHVATLAGLKTRRGNCTTTGENRKTASGRTPAALTWLTGHFASWSHRAKPFADLNPCWTVMGHEWTLFSCPFVSVWATYVTSVRIWCPFVSILAEMVSTLVSVCVHLCVRLDQRWIPERVRIPAARVRGVTDWESATCAPRIVRD